MQKVVNTTVPENNTFHQFYCITYFGVVFYHPYGLTVVIPNTLPGITRTEVGFRLWLAWLFAFISSPTIVQGTSYVDNALRRILVPQAGQKVVVKSLGLLFVFWLMIK
jgi:Fatty acid synthase meander beta sheet domain